ncbi:MAG: ribosome small subunit-dependent GTPase A [Saprospiraceae bacterium]|nr:ribosome small subunit-dependent GTPase A [Saprospiraceae bacterium]
MNQSTRATVVKSTGSWYLLRTENGEELQARIRGKFRLNGMNLTNPVAVGDRVHFHIENQVENTGLITEILPRENYVVRQSPRKKHQLHLLATNVDQAILVITIRQPKLKQGVIDRFLLMTEPHDIPSIIIFSKADIYREKDLDTFAALYEIYTDIGYEVLLVSAQENQGLDRLETILQQKTTLICGQSGVGKSTLVNALYPELDLSTMDISDFSGKGQHTTTFAQMYDVGADSHIIDTPGFKSLSFNNLEPMDVAHNFRELFLASKHCRFNDCLHREEPHCAVREKLESGDISELRYANYLSIIEDIEAQNYWERHQDM